MTDGNQRLAEYAGLVEDALDGFLPQGEPEYGRVNQAMAYSLLGGGKRIRGAMLLAFYRLYRADVESALPFAAALEMIHAYSLIHDDLPCMDDDSLRRGKPSCHVPFGESTALLAGDALLTLAFETAVSTRPTRAIPPGVILEGVRRLAVAAGTDGMIGGQVMDLDNEGKQVDADRLQLTDRRKTGALFTAAAEIGCLLGSGEMPDAAGEYARSVGLAFQIVDDILDVEGDQEKLGKPLHSDREQDKATYVTLYGVERCREIVRELNGRAKDALGRTGRDVEFLCALSDLLTDRQK